MGTVHRSIIGICNFDIDSMFSTNCIDSVTRGLAEVAGEVSRGYNIRFRIQLLLVTLEVRSKVL